MGIIQKLVEIQKKAAMRPKQPTRTEQKLQMSLPTAKRNEIQKLTFPLSSGAGTIAKTGATVGKKVFDWSKSTAGKFGIGTGDSLGKIASRTAKFISAYELGKYAATGKLEVPSLRSAAGYASLQLNVPAAFAGLASGGISEGISYGKQKLAQKRLYDSIFGDSAPPMSQMSFSDYMKLYGGRIESTLPQLSAPNNFTFVSPEIPALPSGGVPPIASYAPSVSVSPQVGGQIDYATLLLLLAGVGGAGYLLGRRKKKRRKKYKRRKR